MSWILPGTALPDKRSNADNIDQLFRSMFLAGGLSLSQTAAITGLESHTIQNWVKRGFLPPPRGKKYDMEQVCRIIHLNLLKCGLPLEQICGLLTCLRELPGSDGADRMPDSRLYFLFVKLAARVGPMAGSRDWDEALQAITADYAEPVPGAREKLIRVLRIMLTLWLSNTLRIAAEKMIEEL